VFIRGHLQKERLNLLFLELLLVFLENFILTGLCKIFQNISPQNVAGKLFIARNAVTSKVLCSLHRHKNGVPHHSRFIIIGVEHFYHRH